MSSLYNNVKTNEKTIQTLFFAGFMVVCNTVIIVSKPLPTISALAINHEAGR